MPRLLVAALLGACLLTSSCASAHADQASQPTTTRTATTVSAATAQQRVAELMAKSDRYLHHSKLEPGMTGYGLTVMEGTKIARFDAVVVSVVHNWGPQMDVVLCRLSGLGLEKGGIIAGMSGSPVYIKDPADGKFKLIGAVAYGWSFQKEPICGVQPIAQMLRVMGMQLDPQLPPTPGPVVADRLVKDGLDEDFVRMALDGRKLDFSTMEWPRNKLAGAEPATASADRPQLIPLATPLMMGGASRRTLALTEKLLGDSGLIPVQAGSGGGTTRPTTQPVKLEPGGGVAIPLISGDLDAAAVGTVTEVVGDRILAFGHAFNAEGPVNLPMGPARIYAVINTLSRNFKLGGLDGVSGALTQDEAAGICGQMGVGCQMIPVVVNVEREGVTTKFQYRVVRHRRLTPRLVTMTLAESLTNRKELPERHTLSYDIALDYGKLGKYHVTNISSGSDISDVVSDLSRPVTSLMNTELGQPVMPDAIEVNVRVQPEQKTAGLLGLKLDHNVYRPGQAVAGTVTLRPARADRTTKPVSIQLPDDLPDGRYTLNVSGADGALVGLREDTPHRFTARNIDQLFKALQEVTGFKQDRLYLRIQLPESGVAINQNELARIPGSMAELLAKSAPLDTTPIRRSLTAQLPADWVIEGGVQADFVVERKKQ